MLKQCTQKKKKVEHSFFQSRRVEVTSLPLEAPPSSLFGTRGDCRCFRHALSYSFWLSILSLDNRVSSPVHLENAEMHGGVTRVDKDAEDWAVVREDIEGTGKPGLPSVVDKLAIVKVPGVRYEIRHACISNSHRHSHHGIKTPTNPSHPPCQPPNMYKTGLPAYAVTKAAPRAKAVRQPR
ncbi:hypothetical protein BDZ97DRAFT_1819300, partial [Flammula alnicola]